MGIISRALLNRKHGGRIKYMVMTEYPVALESPEFIEPKSATQDNTKNNLFNKTFYEVAKQLNFNEPYSLLDLGCAGGGFVMTFIRDGNNAIGLEGTNYNKKRRRFEWGTIEDALFTCDISKPFEIFLAPPKKQTERTEPAKKKAREWLNEYERTGGYTARFDLITMWKVLEQIKKSDLPTVFENVARHLASGGLFICSIASDETTEPMSWWDELLRLAGFERREDLEKIFEGKYLREEENNSYRVLQRRI